MSPPVGVIQQPPLSPGLDTCTLTPTKKTPLPQPAALLCVLCEVVLNGP